MARRSTDTAVDTSFLELVRLGILRADNADVVSSLPVVGRELGVEAPSGQFWHRFNHDGYGETPGRAAAMKRLGATTARVRRATARLATRAPS